MKTSDLSSLAYKCLTQKLPTLSLCNVYFCSSNVSSFYGVIINEHHRKNNEISTIKKTFSVFPSCQLIIVVDFIFRELYELV